MTAIAGDQVVEESPSAVNIFSRAEVTKSEQRTARITGCIAALVLGLALLKPTSADWYVLLICVLILIVAYGLVGPTLRTRGMRQTRAAGPLISFDRSARELVCPGVQKRWSVDSVVAIQAIVGRTVESRVESVYPDPICQIVVLYRTNLGKIRRRLVVSSLIDCKSMFASKLRLQFLHDFSKASGIPVYLTRLRGVRYREKLLERKESLQSDTFDFPIDAPPIKHLKWWHLW